MFSWGWVMGREEIPLAEGEETLKRRVLRLT